MARPLLMGDMKAPGPLEDAGIGGVVLPVPLPLPCA